VNVYWLKDSCQCPMDRGFLQEEGEIRMKVLSCPNCPTRYVQIISSTVPYPVTGISDGFVNPSKIVIPPHRNTENTNIAMTLQMTFNS